MINLLLASLFSCAPLAAQIPCRGCSPLEDERDQSIRVFMSFSVPLESWKSYCAIMARTGGTFVLRGIPKHSFPALIQKVKELREAGVLAPIDIDPSLFEEFGIDSVPAVVISEGDKHDKILGNFQLNASLEEAAESGDTKQLSLTLFKRLKGHI